MIGASGLTPRRFVDPSTVVPSRAAPAPRCRPALGGAPSRWSCGGGAGGRGRGGCRRRRRRRSATGRSWSSSSRVLRPQPRMMQVASRASSTWARRRVTSRRGRAKVRTSCPSSHQDREDPLAEQLASVGDRDRPDAGDLAPLAVGHVTRDECSGVDVQHDVVTGLGPAPRLPGCWDGAVARRSGHGEQTIEGDGVGCVPPVLRLERSTVPRCIVERREAGLDLCAERDRALELEVPDAVPGHPTAPAPLAVDLRGAGLGIRGSREHPARLVACASQPFTLCGGEHPTLGDFAARGRCGGDLTRGRQREGSASQRVVGGSAVGERLGHGQRIACSADSGVGDVGEPLGGRDRWRACRGVVDPDPGLDAPLRVERGHGRAEPGDLRGDAHAGQRVTTLDAARVEVTRGPAQLGGEIVQPHAATMTAGCDSYVCARFRRSTVCRQCSMTCAGLGAWLGSAFDSEVRAMRRTASGVKSTCGVTVAMRRAS